MDINNNFFHWDLSKEVYIEQSSSYVAQGGLVWKLKKIIYGFKQNPKA